MVVGRPTPADRIAQLEAELAETRRERDAAEIIVRDLAALDPSIDVHYEVDDGDGYTDEMTRKGPCFFCGHDPAAKLSRDGRRTEIHAERCLYRRAIEAQP